LERHAGQLATAAARHLEHLAIHARRSVETAAATTTAFAALALGSTLGTTRAATLRLGEATGLVELLIVTAEQELLSAVGASQSLVWKWHLESLLECALCVVVRLRVAVRRGSADLARAG
jgi:hypothetical protein